MASLNPGDIISAATLAASEAVGTDIRTVSGFALDQLQRLERLSLMFARLEIAGEFEDDPEARADYLDILQNVARDFANTLRGLGAIAIEKVWNAVVGAVWSALERAIGVPLPRPG